MAYYLLTFLLCFSFPAIAEENDDEEYVLDDEIYQDPSFTDLIDEDDANEKYVFPAALSYPITYGGMTIICNQGCEKFSQRANGSRITTPLESALCLFKWKRPLDFLGSVDRWNAPSFDAWQFGLDRVIAYDWQKAQGFYLLGDYKRTYSLQTYPQFLELASALRRDLRFYCLDVHRQKLNLYRSTLLQLEKEQKEKGHLNVDFNQTGGLIFYSYYLGSPFPLFREHLIAEIQKFERLMPEYLEKYEANKIELEKQIGKMDAAYREIFVRCLKKHQPEGIAFEAAVENFLEGDFDLALEQLRSLIAIAEEQNAGDELLAKLYLLQGEVQAEFGLYSDAIIGLTTAITKNPSLKEAYFERAAAYFELGEFEKSIEDYLASETSLRPTGSPTQLGLGIAAGILNGVRESATEFIPSTLATLRGLGNGLWALGKNPIGASQDFAEAATQCMEYLKAHSTAEILQDMVPELKELIQNYDHLEDLQKGKLMGHVIGKYGIEILFARQGAVCIKAYRDLKKANQVMTLDALASSATTKAIVQDANAHWTQIEKNLKTNGLKILEGKQANHLEAHINYKQLIARQKHPSIFEHLDPEKLVRKHAGKGIRKKGDFPGMPGYQELVNFEEHIGYAVQEGTGQRTATYWGKIHYAQEGVHIVPTLPPKGMP